MQLVAQVQLASCQRFGSPVTKCCRQWQQQIELRINFTFRFTYSACSCVALFILPFGFQHSFIPPRHARVQPRVYDRTNVRPIVSIATECPTMTTMSAASPASSTWRDAGSQGFLNQAYDPTQSFAYTSACSGARARRRAQATSPGFQVSTLLDNAHHSLHTLCFINAYLPTPQT